MTARRVRAACDGAALCTIAPLLRFLLSVLSFLCGAAGEGTESDFTKVPYKVFSVLRKCCRPAVKQAEETPDARHRAGVGSSRSSLNSSRMRAGERRGKKGQGCDVGREGEGGGGTEGSGGEK